MTLITSMGRRWWKAVIGIDSIEIDQGDSFDLFKDHEHHIMV
jgi:hypothetical protein